MPQIKYPPASNDLGSAVRRPSDSKFNSMCWANLVQPWLASHDSLISAWLRFSVQRIFCQVTSFCSKVRRSWDHSDWLIQVWLQSLGSQRQTILSQYYCNTKEKHAHHAIALPMIQLGIATVSSILSALFLVSAKKIHRIAQPSQEMVWSVLKIVKDCRLLMDTSSAHNLHLLLLDANMWY